ncbi:hypothetical protein GY45DRAFT_289213 [Cubamyces sp. BRFM 1775]|nr:hypothetical protein GY45DRAFT_289213 [Cubamyces sp. BRFM 1775]
MSWVVCCIKAATDALMSFSTIQERLVFINSQVLTAVPSAQAKGSNKIIAGYGEDTASVVAGSALAFSGSVPQQLKDDVINSTLFAQLVANSKRDRENDASGWYGAYKQALVSLGWYMMDVQLVELSEVQGFGTVERVVNHLGATFLNGQQLVQFASMTQALQEPTNKDAEQTFNAMSTGSDSKSANFQMGVVYVTSGNPCMPIQQCVYTSSQEVDRVLYDRIDSAQIKFLTGNQTMLLNGEVYNVLRQIVIDKLRPYESDGLIQAIEL